MSDLQETLDEIIKNNGVDAVNSIKDIVIELIKIEWTEDFNNAAFDRFNTLTETTAEDLKNNILGKYFTSEQKLQKIKSIQHVYRI